MLIRSQGLGGKLYGYHDDNRNFIAAYASAPGEKSTHALALASAPVTINEPPITPYFQNPAAGDMNMTGERR